MERKMSVSEQKNVTHLGLDPLCINFELFAYYGIHCDAVFRY
jgi:hypothetical protein